MLLQNFGPAPIATADSCDPITECSLPGARQTSMMPPWAGGAALCGTEGCGSNQRFIGAFRRCAAAKAPIRTVGIVA